MATARAIQITPENTGLGQRKQSEAAAKKTTELLQKDLEVCLLHIQNVSLNHIGV
jgi:hypothetical protein